MKALVLLMAALGMLYAQPVVTCSATKVNAGGTITCTADVDVTWSLTSGSVGSINAGGVYTAPSSVTAKHQMGGCQAFPNNNVLNTRVDALPVEARSDAWVTKMATMSLPYVKFFQAMPLMSVTNSTPTVTYSDFAYTDQMIGVPLSLPNLPKRRSQQGEYAPINSPGEHMDRHQMTVNRDTCIAQETYNGCMAGDTTCTAGNAASAVQYSLAQHELLGASQSGVGTDAAGLPILATTLKAEELELARELGTVVQHAIRFTMSNNSIHASHMWPAASHASPYCASNAECPGYGARFRLKSAYSFSSPTSNPYVPILLNTLKQYGIILGDGSSINMDLAVDDSSRLSPLMKTALNEILAAQISVTEFEAVDESALQYYATHYTVAPANGYVTSDDFVEIVATATVGGATTKVLVIPVGPTVGVERTREYMAEGSTAQITAWLNGGSGTLTYTMSPAVTGASVDSSGVITAPPDVASPTATRVRVGLSGSPTVYADVIVVFLPLDSGVLRIATGYDLGGANSFTDTDGKSWWSRVLLGTDVLWASGYGSGTYSGGWPVDQGQPSYPNHRMYQYTQEGNKDILHAFALPNGNYKVTMKMADKNVNAYSTNYRFHLESQGVLVHRRQHLQECGNGTLSYKPCDKVLPAIVSDGQLQLAVRGISPNGNYFSKLSAIQVEPSTDEPYVTVTMDDTSAVTFGGTRQLYAVGWWLPQSFTWSITAGPGSIDSNGLYTYPSTPQVTTVTARATSTADPTKYAEISISLEFGTISTSPVGPTVQRGATQQFSATVNGASYPSVIWSMVSGPGTITLSGLYSAPYIQGGTAVVRAISTHDGRYAGSTTITVPAAITDVKIDVGSVCYQNVTGWGRESQNPLYSGTWSPYLVGSTTTGGSSNYSASITGAAAEELAIYRCERSVNGLNWFGYNLSVPPGTYNVRFMWAEHRAALQGTGTWGSYLMDVVVNGVTLLTDYNPVEQAGGVRIAHDRTFSVTVPEDGILQIRLNGKQASQTNQPGAFLNGLTVIQTAAPNASFAITSPTAASTVSGVMTFAITGAPAGTSYVEYTYDGRRPAGEATAPPWKAVVPAGVEWMDGARSLTATAYGADGSVLAVSAPVAFTVDNFGGTGFSFSTSGTSGTVSITMAGGHSGGRSYCLINGLKVNAPFTDLTTKTDAHSEADDTITWYNGHPLATGDPVYYQANNTSIGGLTNGVTYYAIPVDWQRFRLATSRANALAGTYIDLGAWGTATYYKFTRYTGSDTWWDHDANPRTFDSTRLPNGTHTIVCNEWESTVDNVFWEEAAQGGMNPVATYTQTVTIDNGAALMDVRGPSQIHWVVGDTPGPIQLKLVKTDGTSEVLADNSTASWYSDNPSVFTITAQGVPTVVGAGKAWLRVRYGPTTYALDIPVTVRAAAGFPHLTKNGTIRTTYDATTSFISTNLFEMGTPHWSLPLYKLGKSYVNTASEGLPQDIHTRSTTDSFNSFWTGYVGPTVAALAANNLAAMWTGDNLTSNAGLSGFYKIQTSAVAQANLARALGDITGVYITAKDEADSTFPGGPQAVSTWTPFSSDTASSFTQIAVDGSGTLTVSYMGFPWTGTPTGVCTPGSPCAWACIYNAATAGLNGCYVVTGQTRWAVTMTKTGAAAGTYNSTTDPDLRFVYWQDYQKRETSKTVTASAGSCTAPITSAVANGWIVGGKILIFGNMADTDLRREWVIASHPNSNTIQWDCADVSDGSYTGLVVQLEWPTIIPYNGLQLFKAQFDATPNSPPLAWPTEGRAGNITIRNWQNSTMAPVADFYNTVLTASGDVWGYPAYEFMGRIMMPTTRHTAYPLDQPFLHLATGVYSDYTKVVAGDWPRWDTDQRKAVGARADMMIAEVWGPMAQGAAGIRTYFMDQSSKQATRRNLALNQGISVGINPVWTPEFWRPMTLSFGLVNRFTELLCSPLITAPYYGMQVVSGARQGSGKRMLMLVSVSDSRQTLNVDLLEFAYANGSIARWKQNYKRTSVAAVGGSSDTVTLDPGEVAIYVFTDGATPLATKTVTVPLAGATRVGLRYGTDEETADRYSDGADCKAGSCTFTYDPMLPLWVVYTRHNAQGIITAKSSPVRLR